MSAHAPDPATPPADDPLDPPDPLARERAHLAASRSALRAMREDVQALDIRDVTANWVNAAVLEAQIEDRIKALADLSHTPLFFGRLDYLHLVGADAAEGAEGERPPPEAAYRTLHIGRRHVHDADGDPMVIDWRAPASQPFYRASKKDPLDVGLRRRFGYTAGDITAYEDEHLSDPAETARSSKLLQAEIERPRVGPMRDIVATIQPEQDEIVRSGLGGTVCVQGGPGTGKTAVGLHRVAYLLYAHRERLARTGTLVIGPNASFLHYIEQVLPALGELEVKQATVDGLVASVDVRGTDPAPAAVIKGDARMAEVLRRAVRSHVTPPAEPVVVVRGSRRWRVPVYELEEMVGQLLARDMRYGAAREALPQRIAHAVLVRMEEAGEAPDDRVQDAVARNPAVKAAVKAIWPPVDPAKLVLRLLSDAEFLAAQAEGVLTPDEQKTILWTKPVRSVKSAKWSAADAVLIDEAGDLIARTHSLGHVVLDEAQDLSPMQYRAVGRRCSTGSATVLGDLAQGTTPWATASWTDALRHLGKTDAVVEELTAGFRVPREVIAYASRLLPSIAPGLAEVASVRESPGSLSVRPVPTGPAGPAGPAGSTGLSELDAAVVAACVESLTHEGSTGLIAAGPAEPAGSTGLSELDAAVVAACVESLTHEGSTGLIAADARIPALREALTAAGLPYLSPGGETTAEARLTLVPASLAKGLEYDYVVLDEPAAVVDGEPDERTGLRRLYVALTRAVSGLIVLHAAELPEALSLSE
ncbi:AAA family ATPase [Streptomyces scopuliridis]|uniref:AAA family ATPase n=1 Tax=Streptomyces scopuliridis TaxID=452529 RepID=A0ACD4ZN69_9ACTN|nr:UvrD-helicase domain-containing protein [Streptomyces scopuliridis]WSB99438.1 AAA family ATPase [Streptomyces scopuliridis]WSC06861.1 AAA family ATPase [Streptomyces scopuliridis]